MKKSNYNIKLIDLIINSLPVESLKDLPNIYSLFIILLSYFFLFFLFFYNYIQSYQILTNEVFLSLNNNAGSCKAVTKTINDEFLADIYGNWEGSLQFEYRAGIYSIKMNNYKANEKEFSQKLQEAFNEIDKYAEISYNFNLADNLLVWMAASIATQEGNQIQTFQLTGNPTIIFDNILLYSSLSNEQGDCNIVPTITYDRGVGEFVISYPVARFYASTICRNIIDPFHFGFTGIGSEFTIRIDIQSLITAVGVNTNVISPYKLEVVPYTETTFIANGVTYTANYYYYPRYPAMKPLFCVTIPSLELVCAIVYGSIFAYPIFNHFGASYDQPVYCDCQTNVGISSNCSEFRLLPGLLFYDYNSTFSTSYSNLLSLIKKMKTGRKLNREAYNISAASLINYASNDEEWRKEAYKFCTENQSRGCSVLSIISLNSPLHTVSPYYYQVPYGSCNNSFTISKEAQDKLLNTPPTQLTEIYYECSRSKSDSLVSALGISVGNTLLVRYLIIIGLTIILFIYNRSHTFTTYTNKEREKVLHFLAFNLLLSRDKMVEDSSKLPSSTSTIPNITIEEKSSSNESNERLNLEINQISKFQITKKESIIDNLQIELSKKGEISRFYEVNSNSYNNNDDNNNNNNNNKKNNSLNHDKIGVGDIEASLLNSASPIFLSSEDSNQDNSNPNENNSKSKYNCCSKAFTKEMMINPFLIKQQNSTLSSFEKYPSE